jgi:sRNA-binding carbon storage regulator CsrA
VLTLTAKTGERIRIRVGGVEGWLSVCKIGETTVRLGFEGPRELEIHRESVIGRTPDTVAFTLPTPEPS